MSTIYNFGGTVNYNDNSKNYHIDANNRDLASILNACDSEDVNTNETLSVSPEYHSGKSLFSRITNAAYEKGVAQQVDDELRSASVSAPKLVKAIRTNEALGYLDTKNLSSVELYDLLDKHYGLPFKLRNFTKYRSA